MVLSMHSLTYIIMSSFSGEWKAAHNGWFTFHMVYYQELASNHELPYINFGFITESFTVYFEPQVKLRLAQVLLTSRNMTV